MEMLRKIFIFSAISSSTFISPISMAIADSVDSGLYLTAGIARGLENDIDGSINGTDFSKKGHITDATGIGIGYELGNNWRFEAKYTKAKSDVDSVTVDETKYEIHMNGTGHGVQFAVAYDLENDSIITPYMGGSTLISWSDDVDGISTSYGVDIGISAPLFDYLELWGAISLTISPDQTNKDISYDGAISSGFSTGLRIRL